MKTTKALILAGLAVMSLGAGAVNAQTLTPGPAEAAYEASRNRAAANTAAANVSAGVAIAKPTAPRSGS